MSTRVCEFTHVIDNQRNMPREGSGNFHLWGTTILEDERGLITITVAVVEIIMGTDHGKVVQVPPESLTFRD